jgi:putative transposase
MLELPDIVVPEWFQPFSLFEHDTERTLDTYRRKLPHWRYEGASYFLTFRLHDSLPRGVMGTLHLEEEDWRRRIESERKQMGGELSATTRRAWEDFQREHFVKLEAHLDACHGACELRDPCLRFVIRDALLHFENVRCRVGAFVVMPNHVHVLCHPFPGWRLEKLAGSWKRHSAAAINGRLTKTGTLWQPETHDCIVRDGEHFRRAVRYILRNPVKAKLPEDNATVWVSREIMPARMHPQPGFEGGKT